MRTIGTADVLTRGEIEAISQTALCILEEVGVKLPNQRMLAILSDFGARIDLARQMVYFPQGLVTRFLDETERHQESDSGSLSFIAGAYPQYFLDPRTNKVKPHQVETIIEMTQLADALENITAVYDSMGVPADVPDILAPLYMRLLVWKHTHKGGCGQVQLSILLPYVLEMAQIMADCEGGQVSDYAFLTFQMISPLQFGQEELTQFVFFWEHGFKAVPGQILSSGGTAPATLAGTVALQLAENLVINLIARCFYGVKTLLFSNSATVMDMKKAVFQYGRPELGLTHLAVGQLARHYGAAFEANSFLGDAKTPGCEMGMQKALNAIPAIMAGSRSLGTLGLLSVDEIGSPIQLIIDNEYAGALQRFARGFEVNEDTLAYDLIREVGPGGLFTGTEHTVHHYRIEHWQPSLYSREMYNGWITGNHKTDIERASDVFTEVMRSHHNVYIDEETEQALLNVIDKARNSLL